MKKNLMLVLFLVFLAALVMTFLVARKKTTSTSISLPLLSLPTPTQEPFSTPTPILELQNLETDFQEIEKDWAKVKEDKRLDPPAFIFDLGT